MLAEPGGLVVLYDGKTLGVEGTEAEVALVARSADGTFERGYMLAPSEAQRLGQALISAAFSQPS